MRSNKLFKRPKAKNGEGRQVKFKHILIPEEVAEELAAYKEAYSICLKVNSISYEQMLRRWLDHIGRIDPDVAKVAEALMAAKASEEAANELRKRAAENGTTVTEELFKRQQEVIEKSTADKAEYAKLTAEEICQRIVDSWFMARRPRSGRWDGEFYVHPDGRLYPVMKGEDGKPDYAVIDDGLVKCKNPQFAEDKELKNAGFIKLKPNA